MNQKLHNWTKLKTDWMMSESVTLEQFFEPLRIGKNTWSRHTSTWHQERTKFYKRVSQKALDAYEKGSIELVLHHAEMGRAIAKAAYNSLLDPQTGKVKLKPKTSREAAELLKLGVEIEFEALDLKEKLPKGKLPKETTSQTHSPYLSDEDIEILINFLAETQNGELNNEPTFSRDSN